jgi:hypothetical protein
LPDPVCIATDGALWGAVTAHGFLQNAVIVSDDAGQFAVGQHALCWVHAERLVHKLDTFTDLHRAAQERMRDLIWWFYADLKAYRTDPTARRRSEMRARFDRIFHRRTGTPAPSLASHSGTGLASAIARAAGQCSAEGLRASQRVGKQTRWSVSRSAYPMMDLTRLRWEHLSLERVPRTLTDRRFSDMRRTRGATLRRCTVRFTLSG